MLDRCEALRPRAGAGIGAGQRPRHSRRGYPRLREHDRRTVVGRFRLRDPSVALHVVGNVMLQVMRARLLRRAGADAGVAAAEQVLRMLGVAPAAARAIARRREVVRCP